MSKTTKHFREDRMDRAVYIAQTVGFGEIVLSVVDENRHNLFELYESGACVIRALSEEAEIITMYIATLEQVNRLYRIANRRTPTFMVNKAKHNTHKKYIQNQPKGK